MKNYAIGHELGAVRTIYTSKNVCPEIRIYDTADDMFEDVCPGAILLSQIGHNLFVVHDKHAEEKGEPCTYHILLETDTEKLTLKFYGNIVIVGYDPTINGFISLDDEQIDEILLHNNNRICPACKMKEKLMFNRRPIKILFRKPDGDPVLTEIKKDEDIYQLLNSNHLEYTDIGDGMFAISRENAYRDGEEVNVYHSYNDGIQDHIDKICGDVVLIGYNERKDKLTDLTLSKMFKMMYPKKRIV